MKCCLFLLPWSIQGLSVFWREFLWFYPPKALHARGIRCVPLGQGYMKAALNAVVLRMSPNL